MEPGRYLAWVRPALIEYGPLEIAALSVFEERELLGRGIVGPTAGGHTAQPYVAGLVVYLTDHDFERYTVGAIEHQFQIGVRVQAHPRRTSQPEGLDVGDLVHYETVDLRLDDPSERREDARGGLRDVETMPVAVAVSECARESRGRLKGLPEHAEDAPLFERLPVVFGAWRVEQPSLAPRLRNW